MNPLSQSLIFILNSLGSLYIGIVLLRFLLQMVRADFYNELSQAIVKLTNPLLIPLRRIIPSMGGIDAASLVLALLLQVILTEVIVFLSYQALLNPIRVLPYSLIELANIFIYIFYGCGIILVIASFVAPYSSHPLLVIVRQIMNPILAPIQRVIPPLGGLDFSILFFFLALGVVRIMLGSLANSITAGIG